MKKANTASNLSNREKVRRKPFWQAKKPLHFIAFSYTSRGRTATVSGDCALAARPASPLKRRPSAGSPPPHRQELSTLRTPGNLRIGTWRHPPCKTVGSAPARAIFDSPLADRETGDRRNDGTEVPLTKGNSARSVPAPSARTKQGANRTTGFYCAAAPLSIARCEVFLDTFTATTGLRSGGSPMIHHSRFQTA